MKAEDKQQIDKLFKSKESYEEHLKDLINAATRRGDSRSEKIFDDPDKKWTLKFMSEDGNNYSDKVLYDDLLPMSPQKIMQLYFRALKDKIEKIEKQIDSIHVNF